MIDPDTIAIILFIVGIGMIEIAMLELWALGRKNRK